MVKFYSYNNKIYNQNEINEFNQEILKEIDVLEEFDDFHFMDFSTNDNSIIVKIGKCDNHPMNDEEFIEFIMIEIDEKIIYKVELNKNAEPTAVFMLQNISIDELINHSINVYAYCNKFGIWKKALKYNKNS